MRFPRLQAALGAAFLLGSARVALAMQGVKVELTTSESQTVWYTNPFWITVGIIAIVLILVLAILASRGKGKTTTTVIR